jgi:hypothetical protein
MLEVWNGLDIETRRLALRAPFRFDPAQIFDPPQCHLSPHCGERSVAEAIAKATE